MKTVTSSVAFQDEQGNVLTNGSLLLSLPPGVYLIASGGGQVYGGTIIINLSVLGKIAGTVQLWASDELSPQTAYSVTLCAQANGFQPVGTASWFIGGSSPIDLSTMTPSVTGPSYSGAVVLNPTGQQTINGQPLVLENAQLGFSPNGSTSGDAWLSRINANTVGVGTFPNGTDGRLRLDNGGSQSSPVLTVRRSALANHLEFGSTNSAGYGSNLGAESGNNVPFIAFCSEAGTNANTYRTRGNTASIIRVTTAGVVQFGTVSNANADNQTFANNFQIDVTTGNVVSNGTYQGTILKGTSAGGGTSAAIQSVASGAGLLIQNTGASANNKIWDILSAATTLSFRCANDALNAFGTYMTVTRSGATVSSVTFGSGGGTQTLPTGTGTLALGIPSKQIFTSNGTYTIPTGVTGIKVTIVGGGGSGGGASNTNSGGGGGGGGMAIKWLSGITPGNTIAVTVGAGGAAPTAGANTGNTGGASSIASGTQTISTVTANGGVGGNANGASSQGGTGGTCTAGDANFTGNVGSRSGWPNGATAAVGGGGGAPGPFGGGGTEGFGAGGQAATAPGAGGGGGGGTVGNQTGGAGANGIVIFEWVT